MLGGRRARNSPTSMLVTSLKPDRREPGRIVVQLDGIRFASLPAEIVKQAGLSEGMTLEGPPLDELRHLADVDAARRVALRLLAARPRAVADLLRRLRSRGLNPSAVAEVVGRLEADGLLDDREFARHLVRVRSAKGHGPSRLLTDLLAQGVERRLAERAIDEVRDAEGVDTAAQARTLAEKRLGQLASSKLSRTALRRRLLAYLDRRGFRGYEIGELVKELLDA